MGALVNHHHEHFCEVAYGHIREGKTRAEAITAAYREVIYDGPSDAPDNAIAANARRLANRKDIRARLTEKAEYASKLSGLDAGWAMLELKKHYDCNLDDYLTPATIPGEPRFVDVSRATREQLGLLVEISTREVEVHKRDEDARTIRETRIRKSSALETLALMARIAGWEAPRKLAATDPSGDQHAPLASFSLVNILQEIDGSGRSLPGTQDETERPRVEARQPLLDSR